MKIAIIGTGYVGLVSGTCFAEIGHKVVCIDKDKAKIDALKNNIVPIFEPDLDVLIKRNVEAERLEFTTSLKDAVNAANAVFIAVGTPPNGDDGGADLSFVYAVARELAEIISEGTLIVIKSTVPVGTGDEVRAIITEICPNLKFAIASNPEFLREGCAVNDFLEPDRVVVGVCSSVGRSIMEEIYRPFSDKGVRILYTDVRTSELTKYAANGFLATKIAFINEIADICEKLGANINELADGMGLDNRIGRNHLSPGPGFGGSCFPKDTLALKKIADDAGASATIVETVIESNDNRKIAMAEKIIDACGGDVADKKIAILGLAFKANTDDMRYSSSLIIIPKLIKNGAFIQAYDPESMKQAEEILGNQNIKWCGSTKEALSKADIAVILTEWDEFRNIPAEIFIENLTTPLIVDLRNLYSPEKMKNSGIEYISLGR